MAKAMPETPRGAVPHAGSPCWPVVHYPTRAGHFPADHQQAGSTTEPCNDPAQRIPSVGESKPVPARPRNTSDTVRRARPAPSGPEQDESHCRDGGGDALQRALQPLRELGAGYLVGVGSNLLPEHNVPAIIRTLLLEFGTLGVSPVIRTRPVGILSHHDFLNAVVFVETDLSADRLKAFFNDVEERLGRDRSDRARHTKDRPADLDILVHCRGNRMLDAAEYPTESYLRPPFLALCEAMGLAGHTSESGTLETVALTLNGIEFGRHAQLLCADSSGTVRDCADRREPALR